MKTPADRVVILPSEVKTTSLGGIELPEYRQKPQEGVVKAKGPDCRTVEEGDRVLYSMNAGATIDIDGVLHTVMRESDIFVIP